VTLLLLNHRLPHGRWLDRLAEISYPLYLVHATLGYIVIRAVYLGTGSLYLGIAIAFTVVLALAALLHRYVERPGNEIGRRLASWLASRSFRAGRAPGIGYHVRKTHPKAPRTLPCTLPTSTVPPS
jgi:peptidoglycan/LPS O-acetylase OafA/YrhL